ncbi:MAG: TonB-dependent receptor [Xanthobacteraceae bacterium]
MSRSTGRGAQRFVQARFGFVSIAALLCLSTTPKLAAQPATQEGQAPATQRSQSQQQTSPGALPLPAVRVNPAKRPPAKRARRAATKKAAPRLPPAAPATAVPASPTNGYQASGTGITRLPVPLRDTPQTVNVVTQQVLQDQRITTMEDALRTVPGITFQAGEGGQQGDSPIIRGFAARGDMFRDGIRDPGWYTRDLFSADRVEVYKGPSSFAFGRGSTGGAINIVSKPPTGVPYVEGTITAMTGPGWRADLDASGRYQNVDFRLAVMGTDMDTPTRDHVNTKRWGFAPSMTFHLTEQTHATFSYIYQRDDGVPDYGHPYLPQRVRSTTTGQLTHLGYYADGRPVTPVPIPRNNWFGIHGGPLKDIQTTDVHIVTGKLEHEFTKDIKVTNVTRYVSVDRSARPTAPRSLGDFNNTPFPTSGNLNPNHPMIGYPVGLMTIGRQHFWNETNNDLLVNQTDLVAKFDTFGLQHRLAAGLEFADEQRWQQRAIGMNGSSNLCVPTEILCRTSLYNPVDTSFGGVFSAWGTPNQTNSQNAAVYASDQLKLNEYFELLGAVRHDHFTTTFRDPGNANPDNRNLHRTDDMFSWRVGAVFHPVRTVSLYAAYGISFNPAAELGTLSGSRTNGASITLEPERNRTIEVGAKADMMGGRLTLTGAVFRIEKTNLRIPNDPSLPTAQQFLVLDGLARVDGFEIGAAGKITEQWQVFGGYSYLDSEIAETTNAAERGNRLPSTPKHNLTLWTTYAVTAFWTVGTGITYQSDAFVNTTNAAYVPDYWKWDVMAAYKVTANSVLQLNIYNLNNAHYYAQYYQGHAVPASGRWASLSLRVRY